MVSLKKALEQLEIGKEYILDSQKAQYHYNSGRLYYKMWNYDEALNSFQNTKSYDNENMYIGLYHYIALINKDQANFKEALEAYLEYIDLRKGKENGNRRPNVP